ncbi:MAG TPA: alpha/beta family hydrolase, partial [Thermoanaerobaculia bacterium]
MTVEKHVEMLFDGPEDGQTVVLAHGAGAPMDSTFMNIVARGLAAAGLRVARFEFPYMRRRRETGERRAPDREPALREAWLAAIAALGG